MMQATFPRMNISSASAVLNISGLGWYYATVDGVRIDPTRHLDPGWTTYATIAYYSSFNVTSMLRLGGTTAPSSSPSHVLRVYLAGGHYASNWYEGQGESLLNVVLAFDGDVVLSTNTSGGGDDRSWMCSKDSPFVAASVYGGETFDARLLGESHVTWSPCKPCRPPSSSPMFLVEQTFPPIREHEHFEPRLRWSSLPSNETSGGVTYYFDFGQNIAGVLRINVSGCPSGTAIVLEHAELLWPNRTLNTVNLGMANATDTLIVRDELPFVYQPEFTYHGFQYASISAPNQSCLVIHSVEAVVLHTVAPRRALFHTSNEVLMGIHNMTIWSQKANLMSIPTDCPQRDERLGWLADAQLSSAEANINFDLQSGLHKAGGSCMGIGVSDHSVQHVQADRGHKHLGRELC